MGALHNRYLQTNPYTIPTRSRACHKSPRDLDHTNRLALARQDIVFSFPIIISLLSQD